MSNRQPEPEHSAQAQTARSELPERKESSERKEHMPYTDSATESRLQQLQSEEMALRTLLDSVSEYTRSDIESLLQMVRQEIERERALMQRDDRDDKDQPISESETA